MTILGQRFWAVLLVSVLADRCLAYEVDTHALVSSSAFDQSVVSQPDVKLRLGLDRLDDSLPFAVPAALIFPGNRSFYYDNTAVAWTNAVPFPTTTRRAPQIYERTQMPSIYRAGFANSADREAEIRAWFMRGAIREDDLLAEDYDEDEAIPDADPYGEFTRVYHHFFDPIYARPLTPFLISCVPPTLLPGAIPGGCVRATDWAMGVVGAASTNPPAPDANRRQHFSWADAREAFHCALTRNRNTDRALNTVERRFCLATMFSALGHVAHLVQDMAQPQHTRNDRHNPPHGRPTDVFAATRPRRRYEPWINYRATAGEVSVFKTEVESFTGFFRAEPAPPLLTTGYPIPRFSTPVKYFTTGHIEVSLPPPDANIAMVLQRRGIADFSNRNFFSEGTILSSE